MKRFNPSKFKKQKETEDEVLDDSSLSPWQKENLIFLKNNEKQEVEEKKEQAPQTRIDIENDNLFLNQKNENSQRNKNVRRYIKPTDIEKEEESTQLMKIIPNKDSGVKESDDKKDTSDSKIEEEQAAKELLNIEKLLLKKEEQPQEEGKSSQKKARFSKKVKLQVTLFVGILIFFLVGAIYYATPLSKVGEVSVTGTQLISAKGIEKVSKLKSGQPLWKEYRKRQSVEKAIKKAYPGIKSVNITLSGLHNLNISVQEYPLSGYLIVDKIKYSPILSNGVILSQKTKKKPSGVLYAKFKTGKFLSEVMKSYEQVPREIRILIQQITLTPSKGNDQLVTLYMSDGNQVKVSGTEIGQKMKYYNQITSQMEDKGIVDMEVGFYSYPYGNEDTERRKNNSVADGVMVSETQMIEGTSETDSQETTQEIVIPEN